MKTIIDILKERKLISEGIEDPGIFKAIFTAGGPGSGKSAVAKELFNIPNKSTLSSFGLKMTSSDIPFERLLAKYGLSTDLTNIAPHLRDKIIGDDPGSIRSRAKQIYDAQLRSYKREKLGMIIDGTGSSVDKIKVMKEELEQLGYDTFMVFVNTDLEVALARNMTRKRKVPEEIVEEKWRESQRNIGAFQSVFGPEKFVIVDNSSDVKKTITIGSELVGNIEKKSKIEIDRSVVKSVSKFIRQPIKNPIGKKWIRDQENLGNLSHDFHTSTKKTQGQKITSIDPIEPSDIQKAQNLFSPTEMI
jgi:predicted kinase